MFEHKVLKEVLGASPRSDAACHVLGGTFWCGFSWSSAAPGAHLESAACYLQLWGNSCVSCLVCGIWLVGSEGSLRMGSTEADTLLSACGFTWGRVLFYLKHLLNQTEHFSSSPNPSKGPVCLPLLGKNSQNKQTNKHTGGLCCCLCRAKAKFWVPWPIIKW